MSVLMVTRLLLKLSQLCQVYCVRIPGLTGRGLDVGSKGWNLSLILYLLILRQVYALLWLSITTTAFTISVVSQGKFDRLRCPLELHSPLVYLILHCFIRHVCVKTLSFVKKRWVGPDFEFWGVVSKANLSLPGIEYSVSTYIVPFRLCFLLLLLETFGI